MNNAWSVEFSRILIVSISVLLIGLFTGYWVIAILVPTSIYLGWTLVQIRTFEQWIRLNAKTKYAPDSSGIWELIVQHIHRIQKRDKERKKRLASIANRFEAIISALPDATLVLNSNFEIDWFNEPAKLLFGLEQSTDIGQAFDNLIRIPKLSEVLRNTSDKNEVQIQSPTNENITLIVTCVNFSKDQLLVTARDISQRIALRKLRKAFIANASHELRTPLTVIAGYLEMLEMESEMPNELKSLVLNANQQASRMKTILDDLLTLSKLEEKGHSKSCGTVINAPQILLGLVNDFETTRAKDSHQFKTEIDPNFHLKAIESEFFSVCQNLLSNAVKYSPANSEIEIKWFKNHKNYLCLSVKDNGEGIAPEHLSRLTERFYRVNVNRSRKVGGTGLGLSIIHHILENHGGYLTVNSTENVGSEFIACFPDYRLINAS